MASHLYPVYPDVIRSKPSTTLSHHFVFLLLSICCLQVVVGVGPDILARDRLVKDLPSGIFAGKKLLPKVDEKTIIEMKLSVRTIDLEFQTGTFKVSGMMTLEWNDARYIWLPEEYDGVESVPLPFSTVWTPEVILHNSVEEQFMFRQVAVLYHTGHIVYAIAVHTKSACAPTFAHFPWGVQVCSLKFGSWINSQYNVEYRLPRNSTVGLADFQPTVGWRVVNTKSRLESITYPLFSEPTHMVVYDIAFKRETYFDGSFGVLTKANRTSEL